MSEAQRDPIAHNVAVHNRIAGQYQTIHTEIFNPVEQTRLRDSLERTQALIQTGSDPLRALDFGCGTGNLTAHLLELGFQVTAADVAERFLEMLDQQHAGRALDNFRLNGKDLAGLDDASFDLVAVYSVLHHIPDYLAALRELVRVTRPGGITYLDHEAHEGYWERSGAYRRFRRQARTDRTFLRRLGRFAKKRLGLAQGRRDEGDIHVSADDHIEWDRIEGVMEACGCELVSRSDYLLYDARYDPQVFERYRNQLSDYRCMVFRKRRA